MASDNRRVHHQCLVIWGILEVFKEFFPDAFWGPAFKTGVHGPPFSVHPRPQPPLAGHCGTHKEQRHQSAGHGAHAAGGFPESSSKHEKVFSKQHFSRRMAWGRVSSCHSRKTYRFFVNFYSSLHERSAQLMNLLRGFTLKDPRRAESSSDCQAAYH